MREHALSRRQKPFAQQWDFQQASMRMTAEDQVHSKRGIVIQKLRFMCQKDLERDRFRLIAGYCMGKPLPPDFGLLFFQHLLLRIWVQPANADPRFVAGNDRCAVTQQAEIRLKYAGYIKRQLRQVAEFERLERRARPKGLDYAGVTCLRLEARQKLNAIRPANLGQASRISGVSPADIAALMVFLQMEHEEGTP